MRRAGTAAALVAVATVTVSTGVHAQSGRTLGLGVGLARSWEEAAMGGSVVTRSGLLFEGAADLRVSLLELGLAYRQGTLSASGTNDQRDLVEGQAMLGLRLVRWFKIEAGPRLRAYVTPAGTERWVFWEGRVQAAARVIRPAGWAYLRVGRVLTADLPGLVLDEGVGAEGALELQLPGTPVWGRLGYWMHRASIIGGQRVETMQGVSAGVMVGAGGRQ
jgi:hypothetical protein